MEGVVINWFAVIAATLVGFVAGSLWYGPIFGKVWMKESGITKEKAEEGNMAKMLGLSFVFQFIMAYNLAMFLGVPSIGIGMGTFYGFMTGFGWIFMAFAVSHLFEQKSFKLTLIHGGYWSVVFTIMGLIISAWR